MNRARQLGRSAAARLCISARRSASASPWLNPAAVTARRMACSWKSGMPSVFSKIPFTSSEG